MKVAVLGCGPAGLIAAHSARQHITGRSRVDVFSRKEPSKMPGAQYLHAPIPGVSPVDPIGHLSYVKVGTREGYAKKVYGWSAAPVSWDTYHAGRYPAWDIHETYENLWREWERRIDHVDEIDRETALYCTKQYDLVISTIPAPIWCSHARHSFEDQYVYIVPEAADGVKENSIVYDGSPVCQWYRSSNIFGHASTEYAIPVEDGVQGVKPVRTNCDCPPANVVRIGRFGKWDKSALVHHAYSEARRALYSV